MTEKDGLKTLYPFLHGAQRDAASVSAGLVESIRRKAGDGVEIKQRFFAENESAPIAAARALPPFIAATDVLTRATAGRPAMLRILRSSSSTRCRRPACVARHQPGRGYGLRHRGGERRGLRADLSAPDRGAGPGR